MIRSQRFLCLHFANWPLQRLLSDRPQWRGKALALYERGAHGPRVVSCSPEAQALGVRRGMPLSEATALAGEVLACEIERCRDRAVLEKLALWAGRFSPSTGVPPGGWDATGDGHPEALMLEITGCEQLFKGEEQLVRQAVKALKKQGFEASAGVGPTIGVAWAFASAECRVSNAECPAHSALAPLPLPALRLSLDALELLHKLGIHTIGELLAQPRSALPGRFGPEIGQRIDWAMGAAPESFAWLRPPPEIHAAQAFEYAIDDRELLLRVIDRQLGAIVAELRRRCRGARALQCWLYREAGAPVLLEVTLFRASASRKHLLQLFRTKLECRVPSVECRVKDAEGVYSAFDTRHSAFEADPGFCAVSVWVTGSEALSAEQLALFGKTRGAPSGLAMTLDRIRMHCGEDCVSRVELVEEAQPEYAWRTIGLGDAEEGSRRKAEGGSKSGDESDNAGGLPSAFCVLPFEFARPLELLAQPVPIHLDWPEHAPAPRALDFNGEHIAIRGMLGPERIETGWWRNDECRVSSGECRMDDEACLSSPCDRDYYIVDSTDGRRFWIFLRMNDRRWFMHGLFS